MSNCYNLIILISRDIMLNIETDRFFFLFFFCHLISVFISHNRDLLSQQEKKSETDDDDVNEEIERSVEEVKSVC